MNAGTDVQDPYGEYRPAGHAVLDVGERPFALVTGVALERGVLDVMPDRRRVHAHDDAGRHAEPEDPETVMEQSGAGLTTWHATMDELVSNGRLAAA